ncbi:molecular chaperone Hsp90 [Amycolatopsis antarctica]|uniref:Molecular chaperone Hsp90 n=1 Tax=Amycolatopsis antarctica TaxID=1854586 RepID=A0A263CWU2_9PSEU|nr:molecular chaperone Hsp90 [Amycolatopsis antarctica]OZM70561.1 molecular chaperone Hsp90 [Amycolatopsis antarctica]
MTAPSPEPGSAEALRAAVLRAWAESPTRFTEDANAEEDLRRGGYRDRLFVELAQNAADAAAQAGTPGTLRVSFVDGELRVANTGAPIDDAGIAALASLRASAKRPGADSVGRFGVGFAAVLAVTDAPRVVSGDRGVAFSARRTQDAVAELAGVREQLAARAGDVPVLRLLWEPEPDETPVPQGFDTEIRLPVRSDVDVPALLAEIEAGVRDVLLALPWLRTVEIGGAGWSRVPDGDAVEITGPDGAVERWLTRAVSGEFTPEALATLGVEGSAGRCWNCVWALPVDAGGALLPLADEVLHAPTPTDERLSLPARLIATVPVDPSRRRIAAGAAVTEVLAGAATAYPALAAALPPAQRPSMVPGGGFPLSEVDASMRGLVLGALAREPWLPSARAPRDGDLTGSEASVLGLASGELADLLAEVVPGLVAAPLCGPETLRRLGPPGASGLGGAAVVEAVTGIDRPPSWWRELYTALGALVDAREVAVDELAALPVPLRDGRTLPGPRGALLAGELSGLAEVLAEAEVVGLRLVHPDSAHPLLERLGARQADTGDLLDTPALAEAVERSVSDALSGMDVRPLVDALLRMVSQAGGREWLGALALPARDGGWRPARELVLPGSALLDVLDPGALGEDGPLDVLDEAGARGLPVEALTAVGVLDGFAVVTDEEPTEPGHDLPEEREWWQARATPPARVLAVRDLDLVADDAWPSALRLLAASPSTRRALTEPGGHTGWWISRYALLDGDAPRDLRLATANDLAGLYDAVPAREVGEDVLRAAGVRTALAVEDAEDAADLLDRLADPDRPIPPGLAIRVHAALALAEVEPVDVPGSVRALDGSVIPADRAVVLDEPWLTAVWPADRLVAGGPPERLAELLDLPLAGEETEAEPDGGGEAVRWAELGAVALVADLLGFGVPDGRVIVHEVLTVRAHGLAYEVPWWVAGEPHAEDSPAGLGRALAWTAGRWAERHLVVALLEEPEPMTLLG